MARIFPQAGGSSPYMSTQRETFTVWMKSLVYQTNGLTVFNSNGEITYRVENYQRKCSSEVHVMDLHGSILFTIRKKKLWAMGGWCLYRWGDTSTNNDNEKPSVRIRRCTGGLADWEVKDENNQAFWFLKLDPKLAFQILDIHGYIIAQVKQKQSTNGMRLGEDVLALEVNPCVDHSLVVALVTVYGLIKSRI